MNSLVHTFPTSASPQPSGSQHWPSVHKAAVRQINSPTNLLTARVSCRTCRIEYQRPGAALAASPQDSMSTSSATDTLPAQLVLPSPEPRKLRRGDLVDVECTALAFGGQVCCQSSSRYPHPEGSCHLLSNHQHNIHFSYQMPLLRNMKSFLDKEISNLPS